MAFGLQKPKSERPRVVKLTLAEPPIELFTKLCIKHDYVYILESVEGPKRLAEYSFIGFDPKFIVSVKDGKAVIQNMVEDEKLSMSVDDPLRVIRELVESPSVSSFRFRLLGGAIGYISYDAVRYWEKLPKIAVDDLGFPDLEMGIFDDGIIFDHKNGEAFYYHYGESRLEEVLSLKDEFYENEPFSYDNLRLNMSRDCFEEMVVQAKDYIASGDVFQVVLSKRFNFSFSGSLIGFYKALRRINPSPYMYYIKMGPRQIIGSSPEMLVRVENGVVETFPIAGTRPHVDDPDENEALKRELLTDQKECAEHVMLVDLARNDIGRVSEYGTVSVPEFMQIYEYSHVQHIVSRVTGKLRKECSCYDALRAVFPAGTVSGAPKVRAMEIIEELEPTRRGPYAGAVGYFSYNGNADFAITIRSLIARDGEGYIQAGAGVVADSIPEKEWFETECKASALIKALKMASGGGNL
ncbi:MAG: anthranilate synthase component I [Candidatus Bathyarchaeia archaeon]